jgi:amidase
MTDDVLWRSAVEQAELVRSGEVSSRELVDAALAAIEERNPELNAVVTLCAERARAEADAVGPGDDRPLAGVPILVKDLIALTEGVRTTMGSAAMDEWAPSADGALVRKLRAAGAIVVGKTNTPEFGILPVTEPDRFGPCRNPWDTSRTPGGSSGGSGAAVASGMVSLAHANDGGGSIRIPASACGLVGLKPSRGRVSLAPEFTEFTGGIAIEGCLSRTVLDTAINLDAIAGPEPGDPYWAPPPSAPFAEAVERDPGRLRIALAIEAPNGAPVHPDCEAAARSAADLLSDLGHEVREAAPDWRDDGYVENFIKIWTAGVGDEVHTYGRLKGEPLEVTRLEPLTQQMVEMAGAFTAVDYLGSLDYLRRLSRRVVSFWDDVDIVITPTLALPPVEIGALRPKPGEPPIQMLLNCAPFVPFTPVANVTGQPAISLPLHWTEAGLPIGVQLIGPPAGEELLLSLAGQVERAAPWHERRPEMATA